MNRAMTSMLTLALLALPVLAEEAKKTETPAQDSPLVAAAKRANRLGKKPTNVITNETVKKSGNTGHVTTTTNPQGNLPAPLPKEDTHAPKVTEAKKAEAPADAKKKAEERQAKLAAAAEVDEEEYPDDVDPAQAEKALRDVAAEAAKDEKKPPRD